MTMKRKILLAEDEPALGQIVQESLQTRGYEVIFCRDGQQALEAFTQEAPDLLVLDVMMPKKDGFTLASEIRNMNPDVPIIFLTAKSQTEDVVRRLRFVDIVIRCQCLFSFSNSFSSQLMCAIGNHLVDIHI